LRTDANWDKHCKKAIESGAAHKGLFGPSFLKELPGFGVCTSVPCESMHAGDLGVAKTRLKQWLTDCRTPYYLGHPNKIKQMNALMGNIRLPKMTDSRLSRKVSDYKVWKASEFKTWTIFTSLPLLKSLLPVPYLACWARYVSASFLLLQSTVTQENLIQAQQWLDEHSLASQLLYGKLTMTSNLHQTLHWPVSVHRSGPLQCYKASGYESKIGSVKKEATGTKGTLMQLAERTIVKEFFDEVCDDICQSRNLRQFCEQQLKQEITTFPNHAETRGARIKSGDISVFRFNKFVQHGLVYRTYESQVGSSRNCDSCIRLNNSKFGLICSIEQSISDKQIINVAVQIFDARPLQLPACTVKNCDISHDNEDEIRLREFSVPHIFSCTLTQEKITVQPKDIEKKCVLLELGKTLYVCVPPNNYEIQ